MAHIPRIRHRTPYVAVDVDATFMTPVPEISRSNAYSFIECCESGQVAFFCTGRGREESLRILYDLYDGFPAYQGYPGVYHSGAIVIDKNGKIIHATYFSPHATEHIVDAIRYMCHETMTIFCSFDRWLVLSEHTKILDCELKNSNNHMPLYSCTRDEIIGTEISQILVYRYKDISMPFVVYDNVYFRIRRDRRPFVQLTPLGVSPSQGIWNLLKHYGIGTKMFSYVGHHCDIEDLPVMEGDNQNNNIVEQQSESKNVVRVVNNENCIRHTKTA
ncbi:haloacid dehalogenase-like hydrolase family protein [Babesia bovis T2Bo]|uniref:haloacid dehalogenase-like hydrolase family protein n=1 Tax=Babesia bovis T2Bo TaxID=484906 RepID=UPI001DBE249D|nr:haloacid dehalogenase-like hydrolase family protein [Babesia bovis T2Bo]KAG6439906.1 haloacid dehalogenase-like hydrolase family protein [Babesia bovis T2Bo]